MNIKMPVFGRGIVVAVADPDTVDWLNGRYGSMSVAGWLRPLPSGP